MPRFAFLRRARLLGLLATAAALGCPDAEAPVEDAPPASETAPGDAEPAFVGSRLCGDCHPDQLADWRGSHHDRSMQHARDDTILGRFDGGTLRHFERTWRFERDGPEFVVVLDEPGRSPRRWSVVHTFGVEPLQQYLVAFPRGRLRVLPVAWDSRPAAVGGQRWMHLHPDAPIPPGDPLDWETGLAASWNSQCASCHSTAFEKRYAPDRDGFDSRFAEIDVACEACHGPGAGHVAAMRTGAGAGPATDGLSVHLDSWNAERWQREDGADIAAPGSPLVHDAELDVCGPCHARRSEIVERPGIGAPLLDGHRPRLLDGGLYFEDGQIRDEVFVLGSFLQSRMHAAGVRCSDCHDPHSLGLRRPGNALCTGCHSPAVYDATAHHGHATASPGAACVGCHMPARTYMRVDVRRDHAFSVPRPGRSRALDAPDACQACHPERDADWARDRIASWRGGRAAHRAWADRLVEGRPAPGAVEAWSALAGDPSVPAIVRASGWSRVGARSERLPPVASLIEASREASGLEKLGLLELAPRLAPAERLAVFGALLGDERRAVRIEAARALVEVPARFWRPAERARLVEALDEYRRAQEANAERPEAQVNLGLLALAEGDPAAARAAYERALARAPYFVPARVNLADLERALGRDEAAAAQLREAVALAPEDAQTRYALGLALHRLGRREEALQELARAAASAPEEPRLVLAWALSLDGAGRRGEAIEVLERAVDSGLTAAELDHALVTLLRDAGQREQARQRARSWAKRRPDDPRARALLDELGIEPTPQARPD